MVTQGHRHDFCLYSRACCRLLSSFRLREHLSRSQSCVLLRILAHTIPSTPFYHVYLIALDLKLKVPYLFRGIDEPSLHSIQATFGRARVELEVVEGPRWAYSSIRKARRAARSAPKIDSNIVCTLQIVLSSSTSAIAPSVRS